MNNYTVKKINRSECSEYILKIHYAKRWPSVSFAFGLYQDKTLCGIVTYGTPFSSTLRKGVAGDEYKSDILELNRLCLLNNLKNEASFLIGKSLKMLNSNKIVVSFADTNVNHIGYVYQATNFFYCGLSAKRTDWKIKGRENIHGQTIADEFRGVKNRVQEMRKKYGENFYLAERSRKHRYIYIVGDKKYKKIAKSKLRYEIKQYPKDETNTRSDNGSVGINL